MSQPLFTGEQVEPPAVEGYRYGLLSAAQVITGPGRWEANGVVYVSDVCPGSTEDIGGVWPQPCDVDAVAGVTAFTVTITEPDAEDNPDRDTLTATLTALDDNYGPVTVVIGATSHVLSTVAATASYPVAVATNYQASAQSAGEGLYPVARDVDAITLPATQSSQTWVLSATAQAQKVLRVNADLVAGAPFSVYEGVQCRTVDIGEVEDRARRRLMLREPYWVEQAFAAQWLRGDDVITPAGTTALPLCSAVGALEQALAASYGGIGVVHAPRAVAACLAHIGAVVRAGAQLTTHLDNVYAFGAGYGNASPDGTPAPAGQAWLYATGPVVARRTEVFGREETDYARNVRLAVAERSYVMTADCLQAAVLAELPGGST